MADRFGEKYIIFLTGLPRTLAIARVVGVATEGMLLASSQQVTPPNPPFLLRRRLRLLVPAIFAEAPLGTVSSERLPCFSSHGAGSSASIPIAGGRKEKAPRLVR